MLTLLFDIFNDYNCHKCFISSLEQLMSNLHPLKSSCETFDANGKKEVSEGPIDLISPVPNSNKEINAETVEINLNLPEEKVTLISKEIEIVTYKNNLQGPKSDQIVNIDEETSSQINQSTPEEPENSTSLMDVKSESNEINILVEATELLNGQDSDKVSGNDICEKINKIVFPLTISDSSKRTFFNSESIYVIFILSYFDTDWCLGIYAGWFTLNCPDHSAFLSPWEGGIILCSPKFDVYYTTEDHWALLNYKAQIVMVSTSGNIGVRIHCAIAQYSGKIIVYSSIISIFVEKLKHGSIYFCR